MVSRRLLLFAVLALAAGMFVFGVLSLGRSVGPATPLPTKVADRPNVVFILLDALRADRVAAQRNGVPLMPHLTRFAEGAVRFAHAVTPCTWTRPAMASIFTSLYVDVHQVYFSTDTRSPQRTTSDALPKTLETMASFLKKAGYNTAAVQTNGNLTRGLGFAEGFDQYDYLNEMPAGPLTARALELLPSLKEPFFLYAHYLDPHLPYTPPEEYRKLLGWPPPISEAELKIATDFMDYFWDYIDFKLGAKEKPAYPQLSPEGQEAVRTLYDGEVRYLDDQLAPVLEWILANRKNTIIMVLADHGEHLWDHGYLGHGLTMYEEELRVPFFLRGPNLQPSTIDTPVETIGILPTLAALLGIPPSPAWQGKDLLSSEVRNGSAPLFSYTRGSFENCNTDREMVESGAWKLIRDRRTQQVELYDVASDPTEKANRAAERPGDVEQMKILLDQHRQQNIAARRQSGSSVVDLDAESKDRLRRLGYSRPPAEPGQKTSP